VVNVDRGRSEWVVRKPQYDGDLTQLTRYYEEWWENPRDPRISVFRRLNALVRSRIPPGEGKRALDLGSGKGTIVSYLLEKGYKVTAVEASEKLANDLESRFTDVEVLHTDLRSLQVQGSFDLVTAIELAQNLTLEELKQLLEQLRSNTRWLFINISNINSLHCRWVNFRGFRAPFAQPGAL